MLILLVSALEAFWAPGSVLVRLYIYVCTWLAGLYEMYPSTVESTFFFCDRDPIECLIALVKVDMSILDSRVLPASSQPQPRH